MFREPSSAVVRREFINYSLPGPSRPRVLLTFSPPTHAHASVLLWLAVAPSPTYQDSGSGSGGGGPQCINCSGPIDANCIVDFSNETIACGIDTSLCHYDTCDRGQGCFLHFLLLRNSGDWIFKPQCFTPEDNNTMNECTLIAIDMQSTSFPPRLGTQCRCDAIENCSLEEPLVYVHQRPKMLLPTLSPSILPTPHSGE